MPSADELPPTGVRATARVIGEDVEGSDDSPDVIPSVAEPVGADALGPPEVAKTPVTPAVPPDPGSGRVLAGRYRLDRVIGRGAMGKVWLAHDSSLNRSVAVKEVDFPPGMPASEVDQIGQRTMREARAIAAVSDPHVVTVFDMLMLESGPAIVMELLDAKTLAQTLSQDGPIADFEAATVGLGVAAGLLAAHAAGITHRDVKPGNVLLCKDGRIKLTDFGIARSAGENTITATGLLLGSPAYIAPEVAQGRPATSRSDAWGLGALLFACVQGKPPFDEGTPLKTIAAVVSAPVPPHPNAGRLAELIRALLIKDPARRMSIGHAYRTLQGIAGDPTGLHLVTHTRRPGMLPGAFVHGPDGATSESGPAANDLDPVFGGSSVGPKSSEQSALAGRPSGGGSFGGRPFDGASFGGQAFDQNPGGQVVSGAPVGDQPIGSAPVGSPPVGSAPIGSAPIGSAPVGSAPVGSAPVGSAPVESPSFRAVRGDDEGPAGRLNGTFPQGAIPDPAPYGRSPMPPPPWAGAAGAKLGALPIEARPSSKSRRVLTWVAAILLALIAAAAGFFGVRGLSASTTQQSSAHQGGALRDSAIPESAHRSGGLSAGGPVQGNLSQL